MSCSALGVVPVLLELELELECRLGNGLTGSGEDGEGSERRPVGEFGCLGVCGAVTTDI